MQIRDRIKELRRVKASELIPNPKNWRVHPVAQQEGLRTMLAKVGYADAVIVRETSAGLMLVDGHMRAEVTPDVEVPVLVTDLTEAEADEVLATLDPISQMATPDVDALKALIEGLDKGNEQLNTLLEDISDTYNVGLADLLEQDTDADYQPPDPSLLGGSNIPDSMRAMVLHFELADYDEFIEKAYELGDAWNMDNLSDVALKAIRMVSKAHSPSSS